MKGTVLTSIGIGFIFGAYLSSKDVSSLLILAVAVITINLCSQKYRSIDDD